MSGGYQIHKRKSDENDDERTNIQKYFESAQAFTGLISKMQTEINKCPILIGLCEKHGIKFDDKKHIMRNIAKIEEFLSECQSMYEEMQKRIQTLNAPVCSAAAHNASSFTHVVCEAIPESVQDFTGPFKLEMSLSSCENRDQHGNAFLPSTPYEWNEINSLSTTVPTIEYRVPGKTCFLDLWARTNKPTPDFGFEEFYAKRTSVMITGDHILCFGVTLRENSWRVVHTLTYSGDDIIHLNFSDEYGRVLRHIRIVFGCDEVVRGIGSIWNPTGSRQCMWRNKCPVYGNLSLSNDT